MAPGKAVWAIYVDVVCINYDGNAFDAAVLAVMAALRNSAWRSLAEGGPTDHSPVAPSEL